MIVLQQRFIMWWLMWWRELRPQWHRFFRLAVVLGAAGLTAGCWQPLYGTPPTPNTEGVQDKFAAVDIPAIIAPKGTPTERVAIGLRNALQFDLHNGGSAFAPIYQLKVSVASTQFTALPRPDDRTAGQSDRGRRRELPADRAGDG